jgi:hypothetical protein
MPNFGRGFIDRFEPRIAWSGPIKRIVYCSGSTSNSAMRGRR